MDVLLTIMVAVVIVSVAIALWIRHTLKTLDAPRRVRHSIYEPPIHYQCRCSSAPLPLAGVGDMDGFGDECTVILSQFAVPAVDRDR